jgi:putative ABC transport system permease protein
VSFFKIVIRSLRQHLMSTLLAAFSIAIGTALLVTVYNLQVQTEDKFGSTGAGVDAILAPKGSPLQIVLSAIYNLEDMPGEIKWSLVKEVEKSHIVAETVSFVKGHSFGGFHVNAIESRFFSEFEYEPGKKFSFRTEDGGAGRVFEKPLEAVAGSEVAKALGVQLGDRFNPVCGLRTGAPVHREEIAFVGIMAPTGTPYDYAVYIPLSTVYGLEGHSKKSAAMQTDESLRTVSGALLKMQRIEVGGRSMMHPDIHSLKYELDQSKDAQLVVPNEVLPKLFSIIGWVTKVLTGISLLVIAMAVLFLFVSMYWALRERRRNIALMRALGATRGTVFALTLAEASAIALVGSVCGVLAAHAMLSVGVELIRAETGVMLSALHISLADMLAVPAAVLLGILTGLIPAVQAYRLGVLRNLQPVS